MFLAEPRWSPASPTRISRVLVGADILLSCLQPRGMNLWGADNSHSISWSCRDLIFHTVQPENKWSRKKACLMWGDPFWAERSPFPPSPPEVTCFSRERLHGSKIKAIGSSQTSSWHLLKVCLQGKFSPKKNHLFFLYMCVQNFILSRSPMEEYYRAFFCRWLQLTSVY